MESIGIDAGFENARKDGDFTVIVDLKGDSVHRSFEAAFRRMYAVISEMTMSGKGSNMLLDNSFIERYFLADGKVKLCPISLSAAVVIAHDVDLLSPDGKLVAELKEPIDQNILEEHYRKAAVGFVDGACEFFGVGVGRR